MKKLGVLANLILLVGFLFCAAGPALAAGGQLVYQRIGASYYDIWRHSDGTWTSEGQPGQSKTVTWSYDIPQEVLDGYNITGVEASHPVTQADYAGAGGYYGLQWTDFDNRYCSKSASDIRIQAELTGTKVSLTANLTLGPMNKAVDLKDPANRSIYDPMGKDPAFASTTEGWRWYIPYTLKIYGTPKAQPPDLYVKALDPGTSAVEQGKTYNGTITYGLKAGASAAVTAKLGLTHNGYSISSVNDQQIILQPGEEKSFSFTFTGQTGESKLEAKIWPVAPVADDSDWSNNSKTVIIPPTAGEGSPSGGGTGGGQNSEEGSSSVDLRAMITKLNPEMAPNTSDPVVATLSNDSPTDITTEYLFRVNGTQKVKKSVTIKAHSSVKVSYTFSMPNVANGTKYQVEVEVNPGRNKPTGEKTYANNKNSKEIKALVDTAPDTGLGPGIITQ